MVSFDNSNLIYNFIMTITRKETNKVNRLENLALSTCDLRRCGHHLLRELRLQLGERSQIHRVYVGRQRGLVRPPGDEDVGRLRGVEGVPEEVLVPVGARRLERQARDLPVVPADAAAPAVGDRGPQDALEDPVEVDVGEVRPRQRVELVDQRDELLVEEIDGAVDLAHAGGAVRAVLRQLVGAAPDLPHSHQRHLPRTVVVQHPELLRVLVDEHVRVLLRRVLLAGGVDDRHEVVVEVVVAAHAHGEDALAQVVRRRVLVAQDAHELLHHRLVVLELAAEAYPLALCDRLAKSRISTPWFVSKRITSYERKEVFVRVPVADRSRSGSLLLRRRS
jgi:hypothetical protein